MVTKVDPYLAYDLVLGAWVREGTGPIGTVRIFGFRATQFLMLEKPYLTLTYTCTIL